MCTVIHARSHIPSQHSHLLENMNTLHSLLLFTISSVSAIQFCSCYAVCYFIRTSHAKPNWKTFCQILHNKDKISNLSYYLHLIRDSRTLFEIHLKSLPTLSGLAVSLHEPKPCDISLSVRPKLKPNSSSLSLTNVVLTAVCFSRNEPRSIDGVLWRSFH